MKKRLPMSSDEDSDDDLDVPIEVDPNAEYDHTVQTLYQMSIPQGRKVLSLVDGKKDKAYDVIQQATDLQQYLIDLGAIRPPNVDMDSLFKFCANSGSDSEFVHSLLISELPHHLIQHYGMEFVKTSDDFTLCAQDAHINAVCDGSTGPRNFYGFDGSCN